MLLKPRLLFARLLAHLFPTAAELAGTALALVAAALRTRAALAAENLFLRKQLALYLERRQRPRRPDRPTRLTFAVLSRWFAWRDALVIVKPATLLRWHREGFRVLWRRRSRTGRPPLPAELRNLILRMGRDNPWWGEERIRDEVRLKLGLRVSARTIAKVLQALPPRPRRRPEPSLPWRTFLRAHAQALVACDFFTAVTATFRILHVFVVMEVGSRRLLHVNVTAHPTAPWTLHQLREALPGDHGYRFLLHDRDTRYSPALDRSLAGFGLRIIKTPVRAPRASAHCERMIGTLRREAVDGFIPLGEAHLRRFLREWMAHYNQGRPHSALGPGLPEPPPGLPVAPQRHRHRLPKGRHVVARAVLGGLHHEYRLEQRAA